MDEDRTVARDTEQLDDLDKQIKVARQHLDEMTTGDHPGYAPGADTPDEAPPDTAPGVLPG